MNVVAADNFYDVVVSMSIVDDKGREKKSNVKYLVDAADIVEAEKNTTKLLDGTMTDWEIVSISISKTKEVWVKEQKKEGY